MAVEDCLNLAYIYYFSMTEKSLFHIICNLIHSSQSSLSTIIIKYTTFSTIN